MKKAISLMELLIVMGIMTIIAAITIPTIRSYLPSLQLSSASREIQGKLRQAQEEAVTTQIRHGVKFNTGATPQTISFIKDGAAVPDTIIETVTLSNNITLELASAIANNTPADEQNSIFFSSDGGPDASGNIVIHLEDASKTINISPVGVIKFL